MPYPDDPSFGTMIRAARLGWGLAKQHGCFIRMSDLPDKCTLMEFCPIHEVPNKKDKGNHRVWWENGREILGLIPWIKDLKKVHKPFAVTVDDDGEIVR